MPELPEVETTCRGISASLLGQKIISCDVYQPKLRLPIPENLSSVLRQQSIVQIERRAKYIILRLTQGSLIIHLGMSGHLRILPRMQKAHKHDHIDMSFASQQILRYHDPRRFGLWQYCERDPHLHPLLHRLGLEPLHADFNAHYLHQHCHQRKSSIKTLIMDQRIVVGIGNIYASESLYFAAIRPDRPAGSLSETECERLVYAIKNVLLQAIEAGGTSLKDFLSAEGKPGYFSTALAVYGRNQQVCLQCEHLIVAQKIAGRNSFYCPGCQA
ncbi:MAG: bifunctional DNA-formamidopyrimidine glycosylase/DNA-(apurinic or apyrimidinic site) lyase [Legionellaceae bacterium]|nr:bifunctional DNA-formamidopyrimidine glycosylase/DNA-(apurinic or apyrimidinic site) lyase [Legionellaceae bacterium]